MRPSQNKKRNNWRRELFYFNLNNLNFYSRLKQLSEE